MSNPLASCKPVIDSTNCSERISESTNGVKETKYEIIKYRKTFIESN